MRGRRDVQVHPSQSHRASHQFTDFIKGKGGCVGGAAGGDCLIRWFLTDLQPPLSCHYFPSLPWSWEKGTCSNFHAFRRCIKMTFILHSNGEKQNDLAAVRASCRQKEPIKAKTPSRLDGSGAPFSLLSQLLVPKTTEVDFCRSLEAPSVSFQLHSVEVPSLVLKVTNVRWPALRFCLQAHNISLQRGEHPR